MRAFKIATITRRIGGVGDKIQSNPVSLSSLAPKTSLELSKEASRPKEAHKEYDALKSLFYQFKNIEDIDRTKIDILNKKTFYEGLVSPLGPKSLLSPEEKQRINELADQKLQELEDSGLSREEIIGLSGKGIPLKQDPFFQIVKTDRKVRERLFKDNEEYSVKKIVMQALQQDIGYDPSVVGTGNRIKRNDTIFNSERSNLQRNIYKEADQEDYFVSDNSPALLDYQQKDPLDLYKPIQKKELARANKEISVNVNDIHWRNTALLTQFMTSTGRIKHRMRTGLSKELHHRICRTIKHARCMNLLPSAGHVKPYHRIPLRTLHEDLQNEIAYDIDLENGALLKKNKQSSYNFRRDHFTFTYGFLEASEEIAGDDSSTLMEEARKYALFLKQDFIKKNDSTKNAFENNKKVTEAMNELQISLISEAEAEECRPAYEKLRAKFEGVPLTSFMDLLFAEHTQDITSVSELTAISANMKSNAADLQKRSYEEILTDVKNVKSWINKDKVTTTPEFFESKLEKNIIEKLTKSDKS